MIPPPFRSVLVANRGEIACRIMRTAKRLGMRTIAVHSEADRHALFVRDADEAHCIGPAEAARSYLDAARIIAVAKATGAACLHPGYGFLSERPDFAEACAAAGIAFVGPPAAAIRAMGLKDAAKALVAEAGVPVVPGYAGEDQSAERLEHEAGCLGFPVLIKAVAGGGGKGMRRVDAAAMFVSALEDARREAMASFGDARVLVERYVASPRHIEIQVFADQSGRVVSLFERDCSLQRRHQKVIEEAPAPGMTVALRAAMGRAAVEAATAVGYVGAGTVEFILDTSEGLDQDRFFFMEMNTRLQVEHPVTEAVTGLDLVELQFRVAAGEPLPFSQAEVAISGHAVEARLYAEDPAAGFLPSTGTLWGLLLPDGDGIRVETGVAQGDVVTPFYDPMIAKIIAHGPNRAMALDRLSAALGRTLVAGPKSNAAFLKALCDAEAFRAARFDTGFIDRHLATLVPAAEVPDPHAILLGARSMLARQMGQWNQHRDRPESPWDRQDGFALGPPRRQTFPVLVDGRPTGIEVTWKRDHDRLHAEPAGGAILAYDGRSLAADEAVALTEIATDRGVVVVGPGNRQVTVERIDPLAVDLEDGDAGGAVTAPMHGAVAAVLVAVGQRVVKGERLMVLEAMKMEHALLAPLDGIVTEVTAVAGAQVANGTRLVTVETEHG